MNQAYEHLRGQVLGMLRNVEPKDEETLSHALMALIIAMPADEVHKAGAPQARVRWVESVRRTDGWRAR